MTRRYVSSYHGIDVSASELLNDLIFSAIPTDEEEEILRRHSADVRKILYKLQNQELYSSKIGKYIIRKDNK